MLLVLLLQGCGVAAHRKHGVVFPVDLAQLGANLHHFVCAEPLLLSRQVVALLWRAIRHRLPVAEQPPHASQHALVHASPEELLKPRGQVSELDRVAVQGEGLRESRAKAGLRCPVRIEARAAWSWRRTAGTEQRVRYELRLRVGCLEDFVAVLSAILVGQLALGFVCRHEALDRVSVHDGRAPARVTQQLTSPVC